MRVLKLSPEKQPRGIFINETKRFILVESGDEEEMDTLKNKFKDNIVKTIALAIISFGFLGAFTLHTIDQWVNSAQHEELNLSSEVLDDYYEQITDFISYPNADKLSLHNSYEKRGKHYLVIFDGYSSNTFVFNREGKLIQYGTDTSGDLISVEDV